MPNPAPKRFETLDVNTIVEQVAPEAAASIAQQAAATVSNLIPNAPRKFQPTAGQRTLLKQLICPDHLVDDCADAADVHKLIKEHKRRPTDKQLLYLRGRGMTEQSPSKVTSKELASQMITRLRSDSPASANQMEYIATVHRESGRYDPIPTNLTDAAASDLIYKLKTEKPISDNQRHILRRYGVSEEVMPTRAREASRAIDEQKRLRGEVPTIDLTV